MSASDDAGLARTTNRDPLRFGTIVVVGGGCYGSYYVRQLRRAANAGAVSWNAILVVDHDRECAITRAEGSPPVATSADRVRIVIAEWSDFFRDYLGRAADDPSRI